MTMYFEDADLDTEYDDDVDYDSDGESMEHSFEDFEALGIKPDHPTKARPGSDAKVLMLSARYAAGLPLWNTSDCYEHGPRETELMGTPTPRR